MKLKTWRYRLMTRRRRMATGFLLLEDVWHYLRRASEPDLAAINLVMECSRQIFAEVRR